MQQIIGEDLRPGNEFQLTYKPSNMAPANYIAILKDKIIVTRTLSDILVFDDEIEVIANWHGLNGTDAFLTNVGHLKKLSDDCKSKDQKIIIILFLCALQHSRN